MKFIIDDKPAIKKNSRPIKYKWGKGGKRVPYIGKSDKLLVAEEFARCTLLSQKNKQGIKTIEDPVHAEFHFYVKDKTHGDLSNYYELPQDALEKAGIIKNDKQIYSHDGSRIHIDKIWQRTEIKLN